MTKRTHAARPVEETAAADEFIKSLVPRADAHNGGGFYPLWHGWALMDAFLAGIDYARAQETVDGEAGGGRDK